METSNNSRFKCETLALLRGSVCACVKRRIVQDGGRRERERKRERGEYGLLVDMYF